MLEPYLQVLAFIVVGLMLGVVPVALSALISPRKPNATKYSSYECGFLAFDNARAKFDVRFYLVAILFIVFDLEIAFLFPWAVVLDDIAWPGIIAVGIFLFILLVGFIYEWRKGALEWE